MEVRKSHSFFDVCRTPSLACAVTLQPIDRYPQLDCSIIFSDILVIPQALGLEVLMLDKQGPVFPKPIRDPVADLERVKHLTEEEVHEALGYVYDAIRLTRHRLEGRVPLIGFCGGPWTLLNYMIEGGGTNSKHNFSKPFLYSYPEAAHTLLQRITDACVYFLIGQAKAGAQMLQVFESSGGELPPELFAEFALPYLAQIPARVRKALKELGVRSTIKVHGFVGSTDEEPRLVSDDSIPITCFPRCAPFALPWLAAFQYDTFSIDGNVSAETARELISKPRLPNIAAAPAASYERVAAWLKEGITYDAETKSLVVSETAKSITLQGNIDPCVLFAPEQVIKSRVADCCRDFNYQRHIFNLGHGMLPSHSPDAVKVLLNAVHEHAQNPRYNEEVVKSAIERAM